VDDHAAIPQIRRSFFPLELIILSSNSNKVEIFISHTFCFPNRAVLNSKFNGGIARDDLLLPSSLIYKASIIKTIKRY
jgi:hypothetical protein